MKTRDEIPLTVSFELGNTKKSIKDLLNISKGTTYRLENSKKDIVTIKIGKEKIGEGNIFIRGGKMYVEIVKLGEEGENK
ncbi:MULTISPECIES: FliM/FliN family flagellar motor switch protein [Bacillus cereus group]|uniref:Flagellar motor switch protein n=2 Tax=Bacillus cereus group TaxID=86661 RepID=A0A9X6WIK5_BACTU|nr:MULTISPECIES: FliM/FliN family flagellar motor switch protein [Bacillus cereus group]MDA1674912.1 FliM/FliN family flagellar motor switch protein [Bacillus cereus group sp. TH152-1LC]PFJ31072.1 flagellar motor switch protein [Bacillus thuringiensis]PGP12857.1 flagellar motor switch protein [Bacillus cereus]